MLTLQRAPKRRCDFVFRIITRIRIYNAANAPHQIFKLNVTTRLRFFTTRFLPTNTIPPIHILVDAQLLLFIIARNSPVLYLLFSALKTLFITTTLGRDADKGGVISVHLWPSVRWWRALDIWQAFISGT